jgi:hypothetical protein
MSGLVDSKQYLQWVETKRAELFASVVNACKSSFGLRPGIDLIGLSSMTLLLFEKQGRGLAWLAIAPTIPVEDEKLRFCRSGFQPRRCTGRGWKPLLQRPSNNPNRSLPTETSIANKRLRRSVPARSWRAADFDDSSTPSLLSLDTGNKIMPPGSDGFWRMVRRRCGFIEGSRPELIDPAIGKPKNPKPDLIDVLWQHPRSIPQHGKLTS